MRSGDFFAVFCFESQIDLTTWNIKKSYSTPSLNIAVVKTKCVQLRFDSVFIFTSILPHEYWKKLAIDCSWLLNTAHGPSELSGLMSHKYWMTLFRWAVSTCKQKLLWANFFRVDSRNTWELTLTLKIKKILIKL